VLAVEVIELRLELLAGIVSATLDIKGMLNYLDGNGASAGNEWYNGHAFGVEVHQGGGSVHVNTISVACN
jgi:hypothetical protein